MTLLEDTLVLHAAGLGAVATGALLFLLGILGDRARGRRRCPRCWYDLRETPGLTCSECGYEAGGEKKLRRARRRPWPMRIGVLFILAGAGLYLVPSFRSGAWIEYAPNTVLIWLFPTIDDLDGIVAVEYGRRFGLLDGAWATGDAADLDAALWPWQKSMLVARIRETLNDGARSTAVHELGLEALSHLPGDAADATPEIIAALRSGNSGLRDRAFDVVGALGADAAPCVPALHEILRASPQSLRSIDLLGGIGPASREAMPEICWAARSASHLSTQTRIIRVIGRIDPSHPEARSFLLALALSDRDEERFAPFEAIRNDPSVLSEFVDRLTLMSESPLRGRRYRAIRTIWSLQVHHDEIDPIIERLLHDEDSTVRLFAVYAVQTAHQSPEELREEVQALLDDPYRNIRLNAERVLAIIDRDSTNE